MPTYRIDLAYDGSGFRGYAANAGVRTVQGCLEEALATALGRPVETAVAGRTDAGVHARGQVVSFALPEAIDPVRLQRSINSMLGPEVVARLVAEAADGFDARRSALSRTYRYFVDDGPVPDPARRWTTWHYPVALDLAAMNAAAAAFVGEHDFASLCRAVEGGTTVRRVLAASWNRLEDGLLVLEVTASAFCHQMVRSMVALCVEVGRGRLAPGAVPGVLGARDRSAARGVAPAHGLTLWDVGYPPGSAAVQDAAGPPLVGDWEVEATVPGGGSYTGRLAVRPVGETVELVWEITAGRYVGVGLQEGGAWYVACAESWEGLGLALVDGEGRLRWAPAPGRGTVGRARLSPGGPGVWRAGPGAAEAPPFTSLSVPYGAEPREALLEGAAACRGVALACGAGHAVAWGPDFDQVVILRYTAGREAGTVEAAWALGGRPGLAVERLRRAG